MQSGKKIVNIVKHVPTGASIPIIINKVDNKNIIQDYKEILKNRKGFTLSMLEKRWKMVKSEIMEILNKFQVPAHLNHKELLKLESINPIDIAFFFEEYIFGIENKTKISHKKLKPKKLNEFNLRNSSSTNESINRHGS